MSAATQVHMGPDWLKESMVERGLDVTALAEAAGVSQKTVYSILGCRAVSLGTAGKVYRALDGNVAFTEESRRGFLEPARHPTQRLRVVSSPSQTS
jgi:plasmid maintenance system antidote protein VapI